MVEAEHVEAIKKQKDIIQKEQYKLVNLIQEYKRAYSFMPGDKIKLQREELNLESGEKELKEWYLYVKDAYFNQDRYLWEYKFAYITSTGKQSDQKCGIYYHPNTDNIEKI